MRFGNTCLVHAKSEGGVIGKIRVEFLDTRWAILKRCVENGVFFLIDKSYISLCKLGEYFNTFPF